MFLNASLQPYQESTLFKLSLDWFYRVKLGIAPHELKAKLCAQSSRSLCHRFTFLCLSFRHLVQIKQIV